MECSISYLEGKGVKGADLLLFEGVLIIRNIQEIKERTLDQLKESGALEVKVKNAEALDVSFLQLLLAIRLQWAQRQKPLYMDLELSREMENMMIASGFSDLLLSKY